MSKEEFMSELEFILNVEEGQLSEDLELATLKAWDSVGMLSVITLFREIKVKAKVDQLRTCKTVGDLLALGGENLQ